MVDISISFIERFWIYLISNLASIICSIFVLYYFLFNRKLRRSLHNHVIIVLLIINLITEITDIPWILYYYKNGVVWIFSPLFCQFWKFIDGSTYVTIARLVAWTSIERYILIYNDNWMSTKKKKILLHYMPISIIVIYGFILYIIINFFLSCNHPYYSTKIFCGFYSCAHDSRGYSMFEFITGGITNGIIIAIFSLSLIIRLIIQKHRVNQQVKWRKHRKMVIQLISIILLFYIFYLPNVITGILSNCGVPWSYVENFVAYGQFFSYYIHFLLPFVCAGTLPNLKNKIKNILRLSPCHKHNTVEPIQNTIQRRGIDQNGNFNRNC
ncbi:unnamed protein product [Rotaria sordida]|uniref:G-protein coupled receptors family 1 profile domain-containing protein n=1 Tax=Rotaria sordida TaxID=392033 RepID=A0A819WLY6_9BILA|nr:unnamed protein product [Rotaria sordida]CAF4128678.1 unnamed protein product [Rotaria sordida]